MRRSVRRDRCAKIFRSRFGVVGVEESLEEGVQRYRLVAFAAEDDGALEAELEIARGLEGEHLGVDPVVVGSGVAFQAAVEEVVAHRARAGARGT